MNKQSSHLAAFIAICRSDEDALPYMLGFLMHEVDDERLCAALAAFRDHQIELERVRRDGITILSRQADGPTD